MLVAFTMLGMFTNLTMLIPALSIYVWLFLNFVFRADKADLRNSISKLIFSGIVVGLGTILLYVPMIIHEGTRFFNNKWITSESLSVFLRDIPLDTVLTPITWGQHSYLIPMFFVVTAIGVVIEIWKYRSIPIILVVSAIISGFLLAQRPSWIADRFYTFIIPMVAIYFAIGLYHICLKRRELMVLLGFGILGLTFLSTGNFSRERFSEPGYLDIEQAIQELIQAYNLAETDTILAPMGQNYVVQYYLTQYDQPPHIAVIEELSERSRRIFVLEGPYDPLHEILALYLLDLDEDVRVLELERFGINTLYEVRKN